MRTRTARGAVAALAALTVLALPAAAGAHVTVVPSSAPAGAYAVFDVRVPNERDDAATTKVELKLPPGFLTASFQPVPGWRAQVVKERLSRPIETENGPISEQAGRIVFSGDGSAAGRIPPGAFQDFPISVKLPDRAGETLTFKALQTYDDGEVVRWIGAPGADEPAPQVTLTAAAGEGDGAGAGHDGGEEPAPAADPAAASAPASANAGDDDGGSSDGLAIAGLVAGVAGLLAGVAALLAVRRRPAA
jgi:periplasmic copper chaperone A